MMWKKTFLTSVYDRLLFIIQIDALFLAGRMAYEKILTRLPGLQRSPELMQRIEELAKTSTLMPRSSTPQQQSSHLLTGWLFVVL